MTDGIPIVEALAKALDHDDFDAAASLLNEDCVYDSPRGFLTGRNAIMDSYRAASAWVHATFDEVIYESEIERASGTRIAVIYTDHIRKGELWHTHRCRQIVEVDIPSGWVVSIRHQNIDGEAESLNAFFSVCGIARSNPAEV